MSNQKVNFRSQEVQDILNHIPGTFLRWGSTTILFILFGVLFLSWVIKYPKTLEGEGILTTTTLPTIMHNHHSGYIKDIYANEGEYVKLGDRLITFHEKTDNKAVQYISELLNQIENSLLENSPLDIQFNTDDKAFGSLRTEYNELKVSVIQYRLIDYKHHYNQKRQLKAKENELSNLDKNLTRQYLLSKQNFESAEVQFNMHQKLLNNKAIALSQFEIEKQKLIQAELSIENAEQAKLQNKLALNEVTSQIIELKHSFQEEKTTLKNSIKAKIDDIKLKLEDLKHEASIISPIDGKVTFLRPISEGTYLDDNIAIIAITDENSDKQMTVKIPSTGYGKVKLGQQVYITLNNFPQNEFGLLYGRVKRIGQIPNEDSYNIVVEIPDELITSFERNIPFKPNMHGSVSVIIENQRLIQRIFYDLTKVINNL